MTIRNPVEWGADQMKLAGAALGSAGRAVGETGQDESAALPTINRISAHDLRTALGKGLDDFRACRTDVMVLCIVYPLVGLLLARVAFGYDLLPLLFPLASGFSLIGPIAALGLYEMSRRREQGIDYVAIPDALSVVRSPGFGVIFALGLLLVAIFLLWLTAAMGIYNVTLGPRPPETMESFLHSVFTTTPGWALIAAGMGVGFLFALLVLAISVVSCPLRLDRSVPMRTAIATSVRAVAVNPGPMALWGLIVACGLAIGSIPLLLGLIVVVPILGHATWHLYRRVVGR